MPKSQVFGDERPSNFPQLSQHDDEHLLNEIVDDRVDVDQAPDVLQTNAKCWS